MYNENGVCTNIEVHRAGRGRTRRGGAARRPTRRCAAATAAAAAVTTTTEQVRLIAPHLHTCTHLIYILQYTNNFLHS